jgi:hypothetical protein
VRTRAKCSRRRPKLRLARALIPCSASQQDNRGNESRSTQH